MIITSCEQRSAIHATETPSSAVARMGCMDGIGCVEQAVIEEGDDAYMFIGSDADDFYPVRHGEG